MSSLQGNKLMKVKVPGKSKMTAFQHLTKVKFLTGHQENLVLQKWVFLKDNIKENFKDKKKRTKTSI